MPFATNFLTWEKIALNNYHNLFCCGKYHIVHDATTTAGHVTSWETYFNAQHEKYILIASHHHLLSETCLSTCRNTFHLTCFHTHAKKFYITESGLNSHGTKEMHTLYHSWNNPLLQAWTVKQHINLIYSWHADMTKFYEWHAQLRKEVLVVAFAILEYFGDVAIWY